METELLNYMRMWRFLYSKNVAERTHTQRKSQTHLVSMMKWTYTSMHTNEICKMNGNTPYNLWYTLIRSYNRAHTLHTRSSTECDKIYFNEMHFLYWPLNEQRATFANACALKNVIVSTKSSDNHWRWCYSFSNSKNENVFCASSDPFPLSSEFFLWSPQK